MTHDPLCVLSEPCSDEEPKHGYCGVSAPRYCIHCDQWCICERLEKARADEREQAAQRVAQFMDSDPVKNETWAEFMDALIAATRGGE